MYRCTPLEWLYSLLSGPALLTLHELYVCPETSRWLAAVVLLATGLVSAGLTRVCPSIGPWRGGVCFVGWEPWVELCSLGLQVVANAGLLLRKGSMLDPDVGAGLRVIPLGTLMSMQWGGYAAYDASAKLFMGCLTIGVLLYTGAVVAAGLAAPDADDVDASFSWFFLATSALFGFNESGLPSGGVLAQAGVWAGLLFVPSFQAALLVSVHPLGLFVFQGTLLALACVSLAGRVHHMLCLMQARQPKRVLLLFNACALSIAYSFHWRHPHQIALAAVLVLVLKVGSVCWERFVG